METTIENTIDFIVKEEKTVVSEYRDSKVLKSKIKIRVAKIKEIIEYILNTKRIRC